MSVLAGRYAIHTPRAVAACTASLLLAFLVQTAVLPAVGLPAVVPVVLAVVVTLGVALGPGPGAVGGFCAGLLLDLTGIGTLGVTALVGCLTGAAASRIRVDRWWLSGVPAASALTVGAALMCGALNGVLAGLPPQPGQRLAWVVLGGVVTTVIVLPARTWLRDVVR